MNRTRSIIFGVIAIAMGVVWGLNALEITDINIFFDGWWTLFIIVPCAVGLVKGSDRAGSIIGLLIGVLLLLSCQGVFDFSIVWKCIVPVIIIAIGVKAILKGVLYGRSNMLIEDGKKGKSHSAIFSGQELDYTNEVFSGGDFNAVFGGIECDLRNAIIEHDIVINAQCAFGGVEILLPSNVNVKTSSNCIFGGIEEKGHNNLTENTVTVYINGSCIFGGIDIK